MSYHCVHRESSVVNGVTSPCKAMLSTAHEEKHEMQSLNDRLAAYVSQVRSLRQSGTPFDASSYQRNIAHLEEEIVKLKDMYEAELCSLRHRVDEANSSKASMSSYYESNQTTITDLRAKLDAEVACCHKLTAELEQARSELLRVRQESASLSMSLESTRKELESVGPCNSRLQMEFDQVKVRMESEAGLRREAEALVQSLREKLCFEATLREKDREELNMRLKASSDIIHSLEAKIKEVTSVPSLDFTHVLQKLREGTSVELQRYKAETDAALQKNLCALKQQIDSEKSVRSGLHLERERLEQIVTELRARIADTEGRMAGLIKQRDALEESLRTERTRSQCHIHELEAKLSEMNNVMLTKVQECTDAREAQVSLKTEIDAFKALLKEGENRLNTAASSKLCDIETCLRTSSSYKNCWDSDIKLGCHSTYVPRPPSTLRCRPTSAHTTCHLSRTRTAPVDDRVFHLHGNTEYRSSAGTGSCLLGTTTKSRTHTIYDDFDVCRKSNDKRVSVEFNPGAVRNVTIKDDIEVTGKGISGCYSPSFPKRSTICKDNCMTYRKNLNRAKSSYCTY